MLSDFYYDAFDQSLYPTTYGYNAAANPNLNPDQAGWAAVLMPPWDTAAFKLQFPTATLYDLSEGLPKDEGGIILGMVIINNADKKEFDEWRTIHKKVQDMYLEYPFHIQDASYSLILSQLWDIYKKLSDEPFIKQCVMEKFVDAAFRSSQLFEAKPLLDLPLKELWHPKLFDRKYSIVFHRMGILYLKGGNLIMAKKAFLRAFYFDPAYPIQKALALCS